MKHILIATLLLSLSGMRLIRAEEASSSSTLVWCGLDYSMVKMIGTADFRDPDKIFPGFLVEWNSLFMKEMLPELEKIAGAVQSDLGGVQARNAQASPNQIQREDGTRDEEVTPTHITEDNITSAVRSYSLKTDKGLGLVFIMDRLVKAQAKAQSTGCLYVVFFDVGSRKVVLSQRLCEPAGGAGFRNYWFKPIKSVVKNKLHKMYRDATAKH